VRLRFEATSLAGWQPSPSAQRARWFRTRT